MKKIFILLTFMFISFFAFSANRYWVGTAGGAWNSNTNWGTISGGGSPASYPVAGDDAIFDGGGTNSCTLTAAVTCDNVQITAGYTGTINLNGNNFSTTANFSIAGGSFIDNNSSTSVVNIAGNLTAANATFNLGNPGSGTFTVSGNIDFTNGTFRITGRPCAFSGNLSVNGTTFYKIGSIITFNGNTTTVYNNATGAYDNFDSIIVNKNAGQSLRVINHSLDLTAGTDNLTINTGAILDLGTQDLTINGNFTNDGTLYLSGNAAQALTFSAAAITGVAASGTVNYGSSASRSLHFSSYYNLTLSSAVTYSAATSPTTVNGNLLISSGTLSTGTNNLIIGGTLDCNATLDASGGGNVTCNGATVDFTGGTYTAGAGIFRLTAAGTTFITNNQDFNDVRIDGTVAVTSNLITDDLDVNGTLDMSANGNVTCYGTTVDFTGGMFTAGTGTFTLSAAGTTFTPVAGVNFGNVTVSGSTTLSTAWLMTNNLILNDSLTTSGLALVVNGTLDCNANLNASGVGNVICNGATVDFTGGSYTAGTGTFTLNRNGAAQTFTPSADNFVAVLITNNSSVTLSGSLLCTTLTINASATGYSSLTTGNNSVAISTSLTMNNNSGNYARLSIYNPSLFTVGGASTGLSTGGDIVYYGGGLTQNMNFISCHALTINGAGSTFSPTAATTVSGNLTISSGTLDATGRTINVAGNWNNSVGTAAFTETNSTVNFTGTGQIQNAETFYDMQVTGGTRTETGNITITNDFTLGAGGTFQPGANTVYVGRNWDNSAGGTFTNTGSTVTFNTAVTSTISGTTPFNNFSCTTAGKQIDISAANSYSNFTVSTTGTGQTINFPAGAANAQTIASFNITGQSGNLITLTSGGTWDIAATASSVTFAAVQNSNATVNDITATTSKDNGGNDNAGASPHWIFDVSAFIWDGSTDTNWNEPTNWNYGFVPNVTDNVTIPNVTTFPDLDTARTVRNLTIDPSASLTATTAGDNLTVSQTFNLNGTLDIGSNTLTVSGTFNNGGLLRRTAAAMTPIDTDSGTTRFYGASGNIPAGNYNILTIDESGSTFTLAGTVVTNDATDADLTIGANTVLDLNGQSLSVGGDLSASSAGSTLTATGTEDITVDLNWALTTFNQSNSRVILSGSGTVHAETFYNLRISGGTRDVTGNLTIQNELSITGGTLDATGDTIDVAGSWLNTGGAFTQTGSTVNLNGTAGTQQIDSNGQNFNILYIADEAARTIQLLDTLVTDGNLTFENGNFYFNNNNLTVGGNLQINGGVFENSSGAGISAGTIINVTGTFNLNSTNHDIYMRGAGPAGNRWFLNVTSLAWTTDPTPSAAYSIYVRYSDASGGSTVGSANVITGGGELIDCINWYDIISPYITTIRSRINDPRLYMLFSEHVYIGGTLPLNDNLTLGNFNFTDNSGSGNTLSAVSAPTGFSYIMTFNATLTINSIIQDTINGVNIMDGAANYMQTADNYPLGCSMTQDPPPFYRVGIDFFTNISLTSTVNSESGWGNVTDFTGSSDIFYDGLVLTATMDAGLTGTPKVYYIYDDSKSSNAFYIPAITSNVKSAIGRNLGGNNWAFDMPVDENDGNKYIKIVFSITAGGNEWFCYRPLYPAASAQFYECATYAVRMKRIALQNNNTTILNNVINPYHGDTTKLLYTISKDGPVSIVVYDLNSDLVKVLESSNMDAGTYTVTWDGTNNNGKIVARGVYFIRVRAPGIFNQIRKVLVIK